MTDFGRLLQTALEGRSLPPGPASASVPAQKETSASSEKLTAGSEAERLLSTTLSRTLAPLAQQKEATVNSGIQVKAGNDSAAAIQDSVAASRKAVAGLEKLVSDQIAARPAAVVPTPAEPARSTSAASSSDSIGQTVLRTAGLVTGLGPLIAGLAGLFGGGGSQPALQPTPFQLPDRLSVNAGLDRSRGFTNLGYKQDGSLYSTGNAAAPQTAASVSQQKIEITVQAMDSKSFLDHSDDIARAVQQAMLRSHPLNDVISEL